MIYMLGFALGFGAEIYGRSQQPKPSPVWVPWYGCTWTTYTLQPQLK